jgi:hypothetical protein
MGVSVNQGLYPVYAPPTKRATRARKLTWYIESNKVPRSCVRSVISPDRDRGERDAGGLGGEHLHRVQEPPPLPEYIERGLVCAGNPDTVYWGIRKMYDHLSGFGHLLIMGQAGFLDHEETVKGMTLFGGEVYPRLEELPESG